MAKPILDWLDKMNDLRKELERWERMEREGKTEEGDEINKKDMPIISAKVRELRSKLMGDWFLQ